MRQDIERAVREFVIKTFIFEDDGNLTAETSFLDSGIIDSTGVLELITFIEETYGIQFENHEVVPENLDSIHNIAAFVQRKLGADLAVHCSAAN